MKINKIWAIYFSATGTTAKCVRALTVGLAERLDAPVETYDFTLPKQRLGFPSMGKGDLVVFGTPTYAGRVPNVLLKYLQTVKSGGALAIPVVTFGNRNFDNSLIELRDLLETGGFHTVAAAAVSCEHSFSYTLGAGRPDAADIGELSEFAAEAASKIASLEQLPPAIEVPGISETYGGYYKPQDRNGVHIDIRKVLPKVANTCTECGLCAEICPMGSIDPEDIRQMQSICIKCGACFKKCPVSARYFDDEGYLYHKTELEEIYQRRAENSFFL